MDGEGGKLEGPATGASVGVVTGTLTGAPVGVATGLATGAEVTGVDVGVEPEDTQMR